MDGVDAIPDGDGLAGEGRARQRGDAPGFQIVSELAPRPEDAVFDKITMSAFEGTPLAIALRDCGISSIAIVGIATEVGIEPTARHAADLCFIPVIIADACSGGDEAAAQSMLWAAIDTS